MSRYRFFVEYLGTGFNGWQSQKSGVTVQQELEKAFRICLRSNVSVVGAGRTDAGVHARGQAAHFDFSGIMRIDKVEKSVNSLTPESIFIRQLESCSEEFHARYSALFRNYRYAISLRPSALYHSLTWNSPSRLDPGLFKAELESIIGRHDFNAFSIPRNDGKSTVCEIMEACLIMKTDMLEVYIKGNRFLHKMVRSIIGACYDTARKHHKPGLVREILAGNFKGEWTWAPAQGLCLEEVGYSDYKAL